MDIRKLQRAIVDGLEDVKAQGIQVFNTEHLSPLFERVIVASGTSNRQTRALASSVRDAVKKAGFDIMRTEGEDNGEWIIVDCGAAVVHVMQPQIRDYYHLEEIWGEKPVAMKLGAAKGLVKASEDGAAKPAAKKASKSGGSRRSGSAAEALKNEPVALPMTRSEKAAARAAAAEKKAAPAKRASTPRAPAKRAAPAKTSTSAAAPAKRAAPAKKVAAPAKKVSAASPAKPAIKVAAAAPAKKAAAPAKKAPAKKVAVKAAPVKAPAKKAPAKKAAR
ncbi:ribosome-associated protein [Inhella inkyongensis]|uniref:Ribosomal silencing factor RsfS n=1 Tax=Inhella inkyongensis TaxID=392593 RepID=A0A840S6W6_9BURK|nr:ribosome silencing factor [Inhella inkyongensis]MBB5205433.1 ribosome-associated protein [Inhella inkyongensis]